MRRDRLPCTRSTSIRSGGRELFFYYGAHLGSGVGTAAGVKLARPNQQVICLVGDGSFIFGPTALWNMARLELPVIVVVYNNHAYGGPHSRVIANVPGGRMVQTGQFVHDYLGSPDMNMAAIAKGFGVDGEVVESPGQLREALARARARRRSRVSPTSSTHRLRARAWRGPTSLGSHPFKWRRCGKRRFEHARRAERATPAECLGPRGAGDWRGSLRRRAGRRRRPWTRGV